MSNPVKFDWHGDEVMVTLKASCWEAIVRATVFFWTKLQESLSVPNTGVSVPKRGGGSRTIYPHPAPKGMPPRLRTGWLRAHVVYELDKAHLKARVGLGANAKYGAYLEAKDHPWLLVTLEKHLTEIRALAGGKA